MNKVGFVNALVTSKDVSTVMPISVSTNPGGGNLKVAGEVGVGILASIEAATAIISKTEEYDLSKFDIEFTIPFRVDGESAGFALYAALWSSLTQTPLADNVAITGVLEPSSLAVLPVDAIIEKLMAAREGGMSGVILPTQNMLEIDLEFNLCDMFLLPCDNIYSAFACTQFIDSGLY